MKRNRYFMMCCLFLTMAACEKDTVPTNFAPELTTADATDIYRKGATLSGSILKKDGTIVKEYGILYSTLQSMAEYKEMKVTENNNGTFTILLQNLEPGKTYYYCSYAFSGYSIAKGEIKSFTTLNSNTPLFNEPVISSIDEKSFTISTSILDDGGSELFIYGFCWKEAEEASGSQSPTAKDNIVNIGNDADFRVRISDLTPGKRYAVCPYAINGNGFGYGNTVFVTTKSTTVPAVSSCTPVDSTDTSLALSARILAEGSSAIREKGFCYSAEMQLPTVDNMKQIAKGEGNNIQATLSQLNPEITYYIRAYAINEQGTGYGDVFTFTVPQSSKPNVTTTNVTNIGETAATFNGNISLDDLEFIGVYGFEYALTQADFDNGAAGFADASGSLNRVTGNFNKTMDQLSANTTYYIRALATKTIHNKSVTGYGDILEFKTSIATTTPTVGSTTLSGITQTTVQASASIENDGGTGILEKGFRYNTSNEAPSPTDAIVPSNAPGNAITAVINGLTEGMTYYIRAYASNKNGTSYGNVQEFKTTAVIVPTVTTLSASDITETTVRIAGRITSHGNGTISEKGFCWSTNHANPTLSDEKEEINTTGDDFTLILTHLLPGQIYYYRTYAKNEKGTAYGEVRSFTTLITYTPTLGTTTVSNIAQTTAQATAYIQNDGGAEILEKGVSYNTTGATPSPTDVKVPSNASGSAITATVTGLTEGTKYYICAYATNKNGINYGAVTEFITEKTILPATIGDISITGITPDSFTARAIMTNTGNGTVSEKGYCIAKSPTTPTVSDRTIPSSSAGASIDITVTELTGNTTYIIRAFARNEGGIAYSNPVTVTTKKKDPSTGDVSFPDIK